MGTALGTLVFAVLAAAPVAKPIVLEVDAREAVRRLFHARMTIPASPGRMALTYPKWIPGAHSPSGPIADLAGLRLTAGGRELRWKRDPVEMFAFQLEVPAGATAVEAGFDYLSPADSGRFSSRASATAKLAVLSWNTVALTPQGSRSDELPVQATLLLPEGWEIGTSLAVTRRAPGRVEFEPVSFTMLVDAPVLMGSHLRTLDLGGDRPHRIHIGADSEAALDAPDALVAAWKKLVAETGALFGARHYRSYTFLLTLSDHTAHFGLEHHESSDNRVAERSLINENRRRLFASLLSHEMVHSWNGKYRRPAGLQPGSFERPMQGELLWIYEGLTTYLGEVLAARSGLLTPEEYREQVALTAAAMDAQGGRLTRPTADTAVAAQVLFGARAEWAGRRRGVDFYPEGSLVWLDTDAQIREATGGKRSLDDFCRSFHGGESGPPKVVPYELSDVVAALNQVAPRDWNTFLRERVYDVVPRADVAGIEAAGWKLVYGEQIPQLVKSREEVERTVDVRFSLGFVADDDGRIPDVLPGTPADRAGVGPGMRIAAVNGRRFSPEVLRDAIRQTKRAPVELILENGEFFETCRLDYDGGPRYPRLERDPARPDRLTPIIAPRS